ncbi:hypothetical protein GOV05_05670 [Candidatus Woesearchaeota archaeon]|nr:hypothetical protein [Candidatus Woesearchaeota archaeon]
MSEKDIKKLEKLMFDTYHKIVRELEKHKVSRNDEYIARIPMYLLGLRDKFNAGISESQINKEINDFFDTLSNILGMYQYDVDEFKEIYYLFLDNFKETGYSEEFASRINIIQKTYLDELEFEEKTEPEEDEVESEEETEPEPEPQPKHSIQVYVYVKDVKKKLVFDASVKIKSGDKLISSVKTRVDGAIDVFLKKGTYTFEATYQGVTNTIKKQINNKKKEVNIKLDIELVTKKEKKLKLLPLIAFVLVLAFIGYIAYGFFTGLSIDYANKITVENTTLSDAQTQIQEDNTFYRIEGRYTPSDLAYYNGIINNEEEQLYFKYDEERTYNLYKTYEFTGEIKGSNPRYLDTLSITEK